MQPPPPGSVSAILDAIGSGVPFLLTQLIASIALLAIGAAVYTAVTPFRERVLMAAGNVAGGVVFAGAVIALSLPLAAILATSSRLLDILVWGLFALVLQLVTLGVISFLFRNVRTAIEGGNVAVAVGVAAAQIAVALLNAAAMVPN
jgi:putative membrane protein